MKWQCRRTNLRCLYNEGTPFKGDPCGNLACFETYGRACLKSFNLGPDRIFLFKLDENGDPTLEVNDKGGYLIWRQLIWLTILS